MPSNTDCMSGVILSTDHEMTICVKSYDFKFSFAKNPECLNMLRPHKIDSMFYLSSRVQFWPNSGKNTQALCCFSRARIASQKNSEVKHRIYFMRPYTRNKLQLIYVDSRKSLSTEEVKVAINR